MKPYTVIDCGSWPLQSHKTWKFTHRPKLNVLDWIQWSTGSHFTEEPNSIHPYYSVVYGKRMGGKMSRDYKHNLVEFLISRLLSSSFFSHNVFTILVVNMIFSGWEWHCKTLKCIQYITIATQSSQLSEALGIYFIVLPTRRMDTCNIHGFCGCFSMGIFWLFLYFLIWITNEETAPIRPTSTFSMGKHWITPIHEFTLTRCLNKLNTTANPNMSD